MSGYFGLNAGNNTWNDDANILEGMRFQDTVGDGTLTKIEVLFDDATPAGSVRLGVYADNSGVPGALLLDAGAVTVANGWVVISGLNLAVTNGAYYWLIFLLQSQNGVRYQSGQPAGSHGWRTGVTYGALPNPFGEVFDYNNNQYVMRAYVETATGENKVASDSGSGADSRTSFLAAVIKSDSGSGNDAPGEAFASITKDDGGGGVDVSSMVAAINAPDTGGGTDEVLSLLASLTREDSGSGTEQSVLSLLLGSSDSGSGFEESLLSLLLSSSDTGAGLEAAVVLLAGVTGVDIGSGIESVSGKSLILSDTGSGAETLAGLIAVILAAETGSGFEQSLLSSIVAKLSADTGSGIDTAALIARLTGGEAGFGTDTGGLVGVKNILSSDGGAGGDAFKALIAASVFGSDMKLPGRRSHVRIPSKGVSL